MCFKRYAIAHGTFWSIGDGRIRTRKNTKKKEKNNTQHTPHKMRDASFYVYVMQERFLALFSK